MELREPRATLPIFTSQMGLVVSTTKMSRILSLASSLTPSALGMQVYVMA
jgi:hypothetical protein